MATPVLVTGGTGTLGRLVVPRLRATGRDVRVLTRRMRPPKDGVRYLAGDLGTGAGVDAAVDGVAAVVHCASSFRGDVELTRTLVRALSSGAPGTPVVYISIVGVDRIPFRYYASKLATEQVISGSGLPWTTLRTTQFHDLILMAARALSRLPVVPVPAGFRFQPIDADEVAARLVELTLGAPAGRVADMGGPRVHDAGDLMRGYLQAGHRRRAVVPVRLPGPSARALRAGANLAPRAAMGRRTWEEFLAERVRPHR
jgi:uncharacterized protein YbjT (DUF2867 family)